MKIRFSVSPRIIIEFNRSSSLTLDFTTTVLNPTALYLYAALDKTALGSVNNANIGICNIRINCTAL